MGRPRAFTLLETALATIIVGVGVLSIVAAQQAFHIQNAWSTHASIATALGNEIREIPRSARRPAAGNDARFVDLATVGMCRVSCDLRFESVRFEFDASQ